MAKQVKASHAVVFNGNGANFFWTLVEGDKATGPVLATSRGYSTYQAMRQACVAALLALRLDSFIPYDCEPEELQARRQSQVVAVAKLSTAGARSVWHVVSEANWVLQMACEVCPCKKGEPMAINGQQVQVGKRGFSILKTSASEKLSGFTVYVVKEVK